MVDNEVGQEGECSTQVTYKSGKKMARRSENIFKKSAALGILQPFFKALKGPKTIPISDSVVAQMGTTEGNLPRPYRLT
ncbi:hypothetical protein LPN04_21805 [Rugamonas sp. A1-17]|nr:hypothetical protein [Rugamonas sp. A1-17]